MSTGTPPSPVRGTTVGVATVDPAPDPDPEAGPEAGPGSVPHPHGFLARAALVTAALSVAGALLGLGRDQALAHLFGAGAGTDAFLVAWTVPEVASTLLIEDGMAFVLVPAFSAALAHAARGTDGDPVRALVRATLPRLALAFAAAGALLIAGAPLLVPALAPGLPDRALAVDCTRLTATCVLTFGLAGYGSAALRAHRCFLAPAAVQVAYNTGIIATMAVLGGRWGVRSAAAGVAVGGCLMAAVQTPPLWRRLRHRTTRPVTVPRPTPAQAPVPAPAPAEGVSAEGVSAAGVPAPAKEASAPAENGPAPASAEKGSAPAPVPAENGSASRPVAFALVAPVLLFALCRQAQVLVERFLASGLPAGAISHLNYAQKVAQIPMTLSLMLCTVTFPVVARALAEGDTERARARVERDVAVASCLVLLGAAAVFACAPQIVHLLFRRGAFTAADTAATASVMRVYVLGLLGHTLVGALVRSYFSAGRPTWYPLAAMGAGLAATWGLGAWAVGPWGVRGIAAANAVGITVSAGLLLAGPGGRAVPVRVRPVLRALAGPAVAACGAAAAGLYCAEAVAPASAGSPAPGLAAGGAAVLLVHLLLLRVCGADAVTPLLRSAVRRMPHARRALFRPRSRPRPRSRARSR
ncbi:murein biosynthesis integral membrane protein MurJ [Streptomyces minutiscleroticus]|nr:lipid II flippase MurJ [Streptomyces minutiscleroticus]